jgi:hypothetical protein
MYKASQAQGQQQTHQQDKTPGGNGKPKDNEVTDVDFEEVK